MKKTVVIALAAAGTLLLAGGGGAAWWWYARPKPSAAAAAATAAAGVEYRYVTLDKTIVMLRAGAGETGNHYLALDLVFKTPLKKERETKDHLPLLRTVVVKAMSAHTMDSAGRLSIEQLTRELNDAFRKSYAAEHLEQPFAEALIAKLIIE
ncbi:hypothetical protein CKO44_23885 [Rubrivivax gelatinosus]|uniref:Flagellar protein FliL n=1 Tax=Rubrivivax gelatinosus TaxID=28068 RepID=A0ABS1E285_RUBGE|nr:flagellar basal body-associated FliL family protein [Rubrivivax gelatinosus]MBK1616487.1 hypothetical protein [Rubrivivax gelatinosus]MBK1715699.1 hypothetical protein [Rubrivivax gelatinosus]